ncbi:MAG: hypothetical protein WB439_07340 [Acidobacteriaceae bacterium]
MAVVITISPGGFSQSNRPCAATTPASDTKFTVGQVWSFKSRDFEPDATLTILKIESLPKVGEIVHVRIDGIRLRNCSGRQEPTSIEHAPFTRDAIDRSVAKLLRTGTVPAFEDGYDNWKARCGGVYTIPVSEMVIVDEKTFNSNPGCST